MEQAPAVSVVMCTYNGALYVEEQLNSIISQTYPLHELLVFDDASTDDTPVILKAFAQRHPNMKVQIHESNVGFTKNFQQALQAATGELIAISDQDDIWLPTKIEKMVRGWKKECPLIYCGALNFKNKVPGNFCLHGYYRQFEGTDARKIFLRNTVSGHALMIRKEFLKVVLPFNETVMYDWMMAVTAAYHGGVQFFAEVLVFQREHDKNATLLSGCKKTFAQQKKMYKDQVIAHCNAFQNVPKIPASHRQFAARLSALLNESFNHKFFLPLYIFLINHRRILFNYKKRRVAFFSHLKHSYKRTIN